MAKGLRWKLYGLAVRLPRACPANAYTAIVSTSPGRNLSPFIDEACARDCLFNGSCWCGKLRWGRAQVTEARDE